MFIFKVRAVAPAGRDENEAHVIVAETAAQARQIAAGVAGDEGRKVWLDGRRSTASLTGEGPGPARIVVTDRREG